MRPIQLLLAAPVLLLGACIPYATGTTAATVPPHTATLGTVIYFVPGGIDKLSTDSVGGSLIGMDLEGRMGLDAHSDVGVRAPGGLGIVVDYKRRVTGLSDPDAPGLAVIVGGGVVNAGGHALVAGTLVGSGRRSERFTPYGGFKAMHVLPLTESAVEDDPTIGVFGGVRIGTERLGVSPELAVFYDRSALDLRDNVVIVVPSFTIHGDLLGALLGGSRSPLPPRRPPWR